MTKFKIIILLFIGLGVAIFITGIFYDVLYAGIPYQDPTPELEKKYNFHSRIASVIRVCGLTIIIMTPIFGWVINKKRKQLTNGSKE